MKTLLNNSKNNLFIIVAVFAFLITSCNNNDVETPCEELGTCPALEANYLDQVYSSIEDVTETPDLQYGSDNEFHYVDVFEVTKNPDLKRPLILLSVGGGFLKYNRVTEIRNMARNLAARGYVVGVVDYHIDPDLDQSDAEAVQKIWLQGIIDQRTAIRFFKSNADSYRIDPDKVFIGGWSNGGQIAITTATLQEDELSTLENEAIRTSVGKLVGEMGMEGNDHLGVSSSVKGALLLNIYSFDRASIDSNDPAMMFIHHQDSRISSMPHIKTIGTFEINDDTFYGPQALAEHAQSVGYKLGEDLELIEMLGQFSEPNYAALSSNNYDSIAEFFHRNLN